MGIGSCIQNDAVIREPHLLHFVNQFPLHIALEVLDDYVRISSLQLGQILLKG
jgi:hypothetical protein